jgi:hypothetical protein
MRRLAFAVAIALVAACARTAPSSDHAGYNRREMPPSQGLFTGPDGVWTIPVQGGAAPCEAGPDGGGDADLSDCRPDGAPPAKGSP